MKRILFQGDSITDCSRSREKFDATGNGYPRFVKGVLGTDFPGEYEFLNRGISGNRIVDLYARMKLDFINLKPDYASILIGVNDTWHEIARQNGVATPKFEKIYDMLLEELQEALPDMKLMLLSPYVLEGEATCATEEKPWRWETFKADVAEKAAVVKKLANKHNLTLVELQPAFDEACKTAPASNWVMDGVHPTACGHELIKRLWLQGFEQLKG